MKKNENIFNLVPAPRTCTKSDGTCALSTAARIVADSVFADECAVFIEEMSAHGCNFLCIVLQNSDSVRKTGAVNDSLESCAQKGCAPCICVRADESIAHAEGYALNIAPDAVTVFARTKTGAFYGLQSLRQILLTADKTNGTAKTNGARDTAQVACETPCPTTETTDAAPGVSKVSAEATRSAPATKVAPGVSKASAEATSSVPDGAPTTKVVPGGASSVPVTKVAPDAATAPLDSFFLLPCASIKDEPRYEWRGVMLDTARTFYSVGFIKKLLDVAALHKLNRFHWHLTDDQGWRLPVDAYPNLTKIGSVRVDSRFEQKPVPVHHDWFYTHDQIRAVVAYAAARHITVVPEIETPGHASAILASYPHLGCTGGPYHTEIRYGIFDDVLCCGNDEVFTVLDEVIKTVAELFPGPYIHIGGDECPRTRWESCPKCQARVQSEHLGGTEQLQPWITSRVAAIVAKYGKTPIGWDEVLDGMEETEAADACSDKGAANQVAAATCSGMAAVNQAAADTNRVTVPIKDSAADACSDKSAANQAIADTNRIAVSIKDSAADACSDKSAANQAIADTNRIAVSIKDSATDACSDKGAANQAAAPAKDSAAATCSGMAAVNQAAADTNRIAAPTKDSAADACSGNAAVNQAAADTNRITVPVKDSAADACSGKSAATQAAADTNRVAAPLSLPRDLVVMSWRGYNGGIKAAAQERRVIMTPTTDGCYLDYPHRSDGEEPGSMSVTTVKNSYDYSPIPRGFPCEKEPFVLGGQGNLWSELLPESRWAEYMLFPRLCALAEALWLPADEKDFASFAARLGAHKTRLAALNVLYYNGPLQ